MVQNVEVIDLTEFENAVKATLKEDSKPFKVVLSFVPESSTLKIFFMELWNILQNSHTASAILEVRKEENDMGKSWGPRQRHYFRQRMENKWRQKMALDKRARA